MIDQAREWLERLHVSNAPEADMALDLLGRLDELQAAEDEALAALTDHECMEAKLERCADEIDISDNYWVPGGLEREDPAGAIRSLVRSCDAMCDALGADGPEEAIAMARTLREAFE